jgi:hypothetical protein
MERGSWIGCLGGRVRWFELECKLGNSFYRPGRGERGVTSGMQFLSARVKRREERGHWWWF